MVGLVVVVSCGVGVSAGPATLSFATAQGRGTFPGKLVAADQRIVVDLSPLPVGTTVYRAVLRVERRQPRFNVGTHPWALKPIVILDEGGKPLELRPPRWRSFDATRAVRRALRGGRKLVFTVKSFPGWVRERTRLDVTCSARARRRIEPVRNLRVTHRAGQTFITWTDPYPHLTGEKVTIGELRRAKAEADRQRQVRFRIYRSTSPITAENIGKAQLVDEVDGFTAWNGEYYGIYPKRDLPALRYVVREGEGALPPDSGVYVHRPGAKGTAYYAVSVALDGEEDLSKPVTAGPVEETVGPGEPVLQRIVKPRPHFIYVRGATVRYYVRWEAPPTANLPSRPFDYLLAIPPKPKGPPTPLTIALHCWGGSLNGGYGWWYNGRDGWMMVATNQIPYDWWACYHENLYTLKPFSQGLVRSFTPKRIWSFVEWVGRRWEIDRNRIIVGGSSMGGSGVSHWLRYGDRLAYGISWVGVHIPAKSPHFRSSYERVVGRVEWRTMHESGVPAFDYLDDAKWLRSHVADETPFIAYANGKNDRGIGWAQAVEFERALQETRRPHIFVWGQAGHGQRAYFPTPAGGGDNVRGALDIRLDRSLPAFSNCSLDDDFGNGDPRDGDPTGQVNMYLRWRTDDIIDTTNRYEISLYLIDRAPREECTVDVTPRRLQVFRPRPGERLRWSLRSVPTGERIADGVVVVDRWGLVTVKALPVGKVVRRLRIVRER